MSWVTKSCGLTLVLATLAAPAAFAQRSDADDARRVASVRRLLEVTQAAQTAVAGMESALPAQRAANPQIPTVFWDEFLARARREVGQLVELLVPIYAAQFSQAEIDGLIGFYESPLGRRLSRAQPQIAQQSLMAGQQWGAELGRRVADELQRQGRMSGPP